MKKLTEKEAEIQLDKEVIIIDSHHLGLIIREEPYLNSSFSGF